MGIQFNRRSLLGTGAAVSLAAAAQPFMGVPALAAYAAGPALRRNAFTMAENDPVLVGYRKAITAMKALPESNPCSWIYQASIHGAPPGPSYPAWRTCEHGSTYFWSWHRMELYWFERIIRKYSGMYDWAIPYWDWTNAAQLQLPPAFRTTTSALYDASRNAAMNNGSGSLSATVPASTASGLSLLDFFSAAGSISGTHGGIHGAISGNMSSVSTAGRDPIFYVHHSQCDRLWNLWLAQGGGRTNPIGDATWRNTTFTFFDECCQQVTMKGCEVLRAAQQLSYAYEEEPAQVNQYCLLVAFPWKDWVLVSKVKPFEPVILSREPLTLPLVSREDKALTKQLNDAVRAPAQNVVLVLTGVEAESPPGASWEVYVAPAGAKLDAKSPYFVGIVSLFGQGILSEGHKDHDPVQFVFPLDKAMAAARAKDLQVTFVPSSGVVVDGRPQPAEVRANVTIGDISIAIEAAQPPVPQEELRRLQEQQ
jgi:tyrosinase